MWWTGVVFLAVELLLMTHFVYKIHQAINGNQRHIPAETFKSIKYNIIFSDFVIEFFITVITSILMWHLEYETFGGIALVYISTVANLVVSRLELIEATKLE